MSYQSIDELQKALAQRVFQNRTDAKKAAGRALGTLVELITFYLVREWGLGSTLTIELALPEFGNPDITHNVEFGLHPIASRKIITLPVDGKSVTTLKILKAIGETTKDRKNTTLISADDVQRNACVLKEVTEDFLVANLLEECGQRYEIEVLQLRKEPFAMIECKRVGVEEGAKKGPTTIEKAKQGAYVAKHVSSLQKIRSFDGQLFGARAKPDGTIELRPWKEEVRRLVYECSAKDLKGFILTVGIVSNHGNWFTHDDPNKELLVLKQSYDWLLFLNDGGIVQFVQDTIMSKKPDMKPVSDAFNNSYVSGTSGNNCFTKVKITNEAHQVLCDYFKKNLEHIENTWLSVLSPGEENLSTLKDELEKLRDKDWV